MRILISGASGLVGSSLIPFLIMRGHDVVRLVRGASARTANTIPWDPARKTLQLTPADQFDAIINLSGENLGEKRWNRERKQSMLNSRVQSTELLAEAATMMARPPRVFISSSAIGFYGDRGDTLLTEDNRAGSGYLAELCVAWENATQVAQRAGIRVVRTRTGMILSRAGGALPRMVRPMRLGIGGKLGNGKQYMSWIAMPDYLEVILKILYSEELNGAMNLVAPNPVTNTEFTKALGRALKRPTLFAVPSLALKIVVGAEMAAEMLLASIRVEPAKLLAAGFDFSCPTVDSALRAVL